MAFACARLLLLLLTVLAALSHSSCPPDWSEVRHKCFQNIYTPHKFCEAEGQCRKINGRLPQGQDWLTILLSNDEKIARELGAPTFTWLGVVPSSKLPWAWIAGGKVLNATSAPSSSAQCAALMITYPEKRKHLEARRCEESRYFICEPDPHTAAFQNFRAIEAVGSNDRPACRSLLKVEHWLDCFAACRETNKGRCTSLFFHAKKNLCLLYHNHEESQALTGDWIGFSGTQ